MVRQLFILGILACVAVAFSIRNQPGNDSASQRVKKLYLAKAAAFKRQASQFNNAFKKGDEKIIRLEFLKTRAAYKEIEMYTEYWFAFHAVKLNGPPIPFFEEEEADMPEQVPGGFQLIETWLFPRLDIKEKDKLLFQASELLRYATELPKVNESFAFDDNNIFDALMEELYRITALGLSGFDSQLALNSMPECSSGLASIQDVLKIYKNEINESVPGSFEAIDKKLTSARQYLSAHTDFNSFNRMEFIQQFLDPITISVGRFKTAMKFHNNPSASFYSAVNKNNSLFKPGTFDPYRFLDDNTSSPAKISLGRKLFFEKRLSSNNQRSCASCHVPGKAFTDGLPTSLALDGHTQLPRNAPTIWNAALQRNLFADSRSRNLELQVMQVLNNANEMHGAAKEVAGMIVRQKEYQRVYDEAFPGSSDEQAADNICNAIACYERTLIALNAKFDRYMNGKALMNANEINGFNLFMGKAKCGTCHFMPLFGGAKPPRYYYNESEVLGVPEDAHAKPQVLDNDSGRILATGYPVHLFAFKTPSLRNVALTAPYMHNGVFKTLEEVIDFYDKGGGKGIGISLPNQSLSFDKLNLTKKEKSDLILFMKTLTDTARAY